MRPVMVAVAVAAALIGGCVDQGGSADVPTDSGGPSATADAGENVDPSAAVGSLTGTVVDDELRPIKGVTVAIKEPAVSALTDESGAFAIVNLPVGVHDVFADRLGYESRAAKVTIEAGKEAKHDFTLVPLALDEAFIDYWHRTLIYDCLLFANPAWVSACSWPYTAVYEEAHNNGVNLSNYGAPSDVQDNKVRINFTVGFGIRGVVSELVWVANTESARRMMLAHCDPKGYDPVLDSCTSMGGGNARSPLRAEWEVPKTYAPKTEGQQVWIMAGVWPWPETITDPPGVVLEQKIDLYESRFYGEDPPEDFSILPPTGGG